MFETYVRSITAMFEALPSKQFKSELAKVTGSLSESIDYLRDVCEETGL